MDRAFPKPRIQGVEVWTLGFPGQPIRLATGP